MKSGPSPAENGPGPMKSGPSPPETGPGPDEKAHFSSDLVRLARSTFQTGPKEPGLVKSGPSSETGPGQVKCAPRPRLDQIRQRVDLSSNEWT